MESDAPATSRSATSADLQARAHMRLAIELLRIGIGLVWAVNLVFIVAPQNGYFSSFSHTAASFAPTSLGGPGLANFVAQNPVPFAWTIALITGYLAIAFLLGITVRFACIVGGVFSAVLIGVQVGSTYNLPGGTDVGPHPLYILVYVALLLGAAGQAYSVGPWASAAWARRRAARPSALARPARPVWAASLTPRAVFAYFAAGVLISFGVGVGLIVALPPPTAGATSAGEQTYFENLTIVVNATNGWPQYLPANFTVHTGLVVFTITDFDSVMSWSACPCRVTGTVGNNEWINNTTTVPILSGQNVAHSFNIPKLGLAVYLPGMSSVRFTVDLLNPGQFYWVCIVPCGTGANPYNSPPMGVPGWMMGTMTIVS
jgi:hypothetical protein